MDVFGNSLYIASQSQWSQTGYMPSLNSFTSTNTTNTWSQTPPNNVPWGISYSQTLPNVIRFTGQSDISFPHHNSISSSLPHLRIKRHLDDSDDNSLDNSSVLSKPPAKQFITEEKMAAKMNDMHISNAFTTFSQDPHSQQGYQHSGFFTGGNNCCTTATTMTMSSSQCQTNDVEDSNDMMDEIDTSSNNNNKSCNNNGEMPSLYLSEELKSLTCPMDPLIPKNLLTRNLNSQALVLWQPRVGLEAFPWSSEYTVQHPSSPQSSDDESEFIRSDDPACNVVITEITEPNHRTEEGNMAMDL